MIKYIVKKVLASPLFIDLLIEVVIAVMDRRVTDQEKSKIKYRISNLAIGLLSGD
jgi:hypothetical protein